MNDNDTFTTEPFADWDETKALAALDEAILATTVTVLLDNGYTMELSALNEGDVSIIEILADADLRTREPGPADVASRTFVGGAK